MKTNLESYTFGGGVNFYDNGNHSGFSWCYMNGWSDDMQWWCGPREFQIQSSFAGQITKPIRAFMDDFGTLVAVH